MGSRRVFLTRCAMAGGLVAGYGAFASIAGRYLYPEDGREPLWVYVAVVGDMVDGTSRELVLPSGARAALARRGATGDVSDFVALSSTCPHLGCQVHWEAAGARFFCPCHNGAFDATGVATAGPPAAAGQALARYPLKIEGGLLYLGVPWGA